MTTYFRDKWRKNCKVTRTITFKKFLLFNLPFVYLFLYEILGMVLFRFVILILCLYVGILSSALLDNGKSPQWVIIKFIYGEHSTILNSFVILYYILHVAKIVKSDFLFYCVNKTASFFVRSKTPSKSQFYIDIL